MGGWAAHSMGERLGLGLWLLPVTQPERAFKVTRGQGALEARFDEVGLRHWEISRESAI